MPRQCGRGIVSVGAGLAAVANVATMVSVVVLAEIPASVGPGVGAASVQAGRAVWMTRAVPRGIFIIGGLFPFPEEFAHGVILSPCWRVSGARSFFLAAQGSVS